MNVPALVRIQRKTVIEGDCWVWTGARLKHRDGYLTYGQITVDGKRRLVHREAWESVHGPLLGGAQILHTCDNPPCWRPDHLFAGDRHANMRDMANKGRQVYQRESTKVPRGERAANAVLSDRLVVEILSAYADGQGTQRELAVLFGVGQDRIAKIIRGTGWVHVEAKPGVREACRTRAEMARRGGRSVA